jgi:hypothetical protein
MHTNAGRGGAAHRPACSRSASPARRCPTAGPPPPPPPPKRSPPEKTTSPAAAAAARAAGRSDAGEGERAAGAMCPARLVLLRLARWGRRRLTAEVVSAAEGRVGEEDGAAAHHGVVANHGAAANEGFRTQRGPSAEDAPLPELAALLECRARSCGGGERDSALSACTAYGNHIDGHASISSTENV